MKSHFYFDQLFPDQDQQPRDFQLNQKKILGTGIYRMSNQQQHFNDDDEQQAIEQQLLKKTSQLHEALRNIKVLKFQLIEAKIMKKLNLVKCQEQKIKLANLQKGKTNLQQENAALQKQIQLNLQAVRKQKERNHSSYEKLNNIDRQLTKAKLLYRSTLNNNKEIQILYQQKQNVSGVENNGNNRYISIEKLALQAENQSYDELVKLTKQQIIQTKTKIEEVELRKKDLQSQYQSLLESLKTHQHKTQTVKGNLSTYRQCNHSKAAIKSQQIYQIGGIIQQISKEDKTLHQTKNKQAHPATSSKKMTFVTDNKNRKSLKNVPSSILTAKRSKIF